MKKSNCNIIRDLLPLYTDSSTSPETNDYVEAHLSQCTACRNVLAEMTREIPAELPPCEEDAAAQTLRKGMKKLRFRWFVSLVLAVLLLGGGIYGWAQSQLPDEGPENTAERSICDAFLTELRDGNYEAAYGYIDIDAIRKEWEKEFFSAEALADIKERGLVFFTEGCSGLKEEGLTDFRFRDVYAYPLDFEFTYTVTVGGKDESIHLTVTENGIRFIGCGNGSLVNPDALARLRLWSEYLWRDYAEYDYDPEKGYFRPDKT